jgi:Uma2 family endonuclease
MAASTLVTLEQYLRTSYRTDVEFIDGELKEKPLVQWAHGRLQILIGNWFGAHEDDWGVIVAAGIRTKVSSSRVRLPDIVVVTAGPQPGMLVEPPLIVIEILSPDDTYTETERRAQDYRRMGIENIWLIDPESWTARVCREDAWVETMRFTVEGRPIYLDVTVLFARLDKYAGGKQL